MDLSVIIATYNRARSVAETLAALLHLDLAGNSWELIVVDNRSSDETRSILEQFSRRLPLRHLYERVQGKNHALNRALGVARGQLLVFADDDVSPEPDWLREVAAASRRWPHHEVFGGRVTPRFPPTTPPHVRSASFAEYVFAIHDPILNEGPYPSAGSPVGPNCWVRRRVFERGVRFDPGIGPRGRNRVSGSELELFTRLRTDGVEPIYVPSACVYHRIQLHQTKVPYLLRRSYASGRGSVRIFGFPEHAKRLHGAPRYLYRQAMEAAATCAGHALCIDRKGALEQLLHCAQFLGCIREARSLRGQSRAGRSRVLVGESRK
jgi:glycosyltransferase involved in cell wall biosynthesis